MILPKSMVCSTLLVHVTIKVRAMLAWTALGMFGWFISVPPFGAEQRDRTATTTFRRYQAGAGRLVVAMTTRSEYFYRHGRCCCPASVIAFQSNLRPIKAGR
jgi:hypothetical protein